MGNKTKKKDRMYVHAESQIISLETGCPFLSTSDIDPYTVTVTSFENGFEGSPEGADIIEF